MVDVGAMIKQKRLEKGMTLEELGNKVGVGKSTVRKWENGMIQNMRRDKIEKLATALGINPLDILGRPVPSNISIPAGRAVPILGTICAGDGVVCEQNYDGGFFIDREIKADYCLRVHGDSMVGAGISDGDYAFLLKDYDYEDGAIYAVVIDGEDLAVLKKVTRSNDKVILSPCNDNYDPMIENYVDIFIVGKLCGVYHKVD